VLVSSRTLFEKIWSRHVIAEEDGEFLLYIDRALIHEGSSHAFDTLREQKRRLFRPRQVFAFNDHYVPTSGRSKGVNGIAVAEIRNMVLQLEANAKEHDITHFGIDHPQQGILHIVPPEQGITQPGLVMVGADSHTSTHGAFGTLAFGVGASEIMHVMATQTLWQRKPKTLRIQIEGELGFGVSAKDLILAIIARIGVGGGVGYVLEYAGSTVRAMEMYCLTVAEEMGTKSVPGLRRKRWTCSTCLESMRSVSRSALSRMRKSRSKRERSELGKSTFSLMLRRLL
jgi:3-isopropylmalate/(R)-2-methylmalate dehydratase large subunit